MAGNDSKPLPNLKPEQIVRFRSHIKRGALEECWPWMGKRNYSGYGVLKLYIKGRYIQLRAHRVAYRLATGIDPLVFKVCHTCDNPPCCNPAHLFKGTQADNVVDRDRKGRAATGESSGPAKYPERFQGERHYHILTEDQVRQIRARYSPGSLPLAVARDVGKEFGVSSHCILGIVNRHKWKHI